MSARPRAISRRDFLEISSVTGVGLVIGFRLPLRALPATSAPSALSPLNAWVTIGTDGSVTFTVDKSEMGQGAVNGLAMILAEELEADWSRVRLGPAPSDPAAWSRRMSTGGSTSVRRSWDLLRRVGATAREMLRTAAAETWGVEPQTCRAVQGAVVHVPSGRRLGYGELAERAAAVTPPTDPPLKDPADFRLLGKRVKRLDTPGKVKATATYGIDVRVPGMLVASIERSPVFGGRVARYDATRARAVEGVRHTVEIKGTASEWATAGGPAYFESGIAVVADTYWQAVQGRRALAITWDEGPNASLSSETITERLRELAEGPGTAARDDGDVQRALATAATTLEAAYQVPYLHHATMEPMNCTAHVRRDGCDVWAPTQSQTTAQEVAAALAGLPKEQVRIHTTFLGGGFGRRLEPDFVAEAVLVSKAVGAPVKVIWSREDDVQHGFYRPTVHHRFRGGLDARGRPVAWSHHIAAPSILGFKRWLDRPDARDGSTLEGAANLPYGIPNLRVAYSNADVPVPLGFWRSVGSSHNAFATEAFIDELAAAAGADPFEFRRPLLANHPRHRRVLELAAMKAGWGTPPPGGRARGIAVAESFGSFVAHVAEVSLDGRELRVHRVVCAVDCGPTVNPDSIEAQMESGIVFGLTAALYGEITIANGRVAQSNFHDYPMLRMNRMPAVEVHVVPSSDAQGGIGEPGVPPIAPAVCNALFALTSKRIRKLPIGNLG